MTAVAENRSVAPPWVPRNHAGEGAERIRTAETTRGTSRGMSRGMIARYRPWPAWAATLLLAAFLAAVAVAAALYGGAP